MSASHGFARRCRDRPAYSMGSGGLKPGGEEGIHWPSAAIPRASRYQRSRPSCWRANSAHKDAAASGARWWRRARTASLRTPASGSAKDFTKGITSCFLFAGEPEGGDAKIGDRDPSAAAR